MTRKTQANLSRCWIENPSGRSSSWFVLVRRGVESVKKVYDDFGFASEPELDVWCRRELFPPTGGVFLPSSPRVLQIASGSMVA
jgi:hypothetical protein